MRKHSPNAIKGCNITIKDMHKERNRGKSCVDCIVKDSSLMAPRLDNGYSRDQLKSTICANKKRTFSCEEHLNSTIEEFLLKKIVCKSIQ